MKARRRITQSFRLRPINIPPEGWPLPSEFKSFLFFLYFIFLLTVFYNCPLSRCYVLANFSHHFMNWMPRPLWVPASTCTSLAGGGSSSRPSPHMQHDPTSVFDHCPDNHPACCQSSLFPVSFWLTLTLQSSGVLVLSLAAPLSPGKH